MKTQNHQFVLFGVIGVIVVLFILFMTPKPLRQPIVQASPVAKVTTANEFASPQTALRKQNPQSFTLNVTAPLDGQKVTTSTIVVTGQTVAHADVYVNDIDVKADQTGKFSVSYPLEEGTNYLVVGANDDAGNYNEQQLTVYLDNNSNLNREDFYDKKNNAGSIFEHCIAREFVIGGPRPVTA